MLDEAATAFLPVQSASPSSETEDFPNMSDWNAKTITEFRANEGRVGGVFEGAPMALLHHLGRKSGREYVTPAMYLPHEGNPDSIYVLQRKVECRPTRTGTTT